MDILSNFRTHASKLQKTIVLPEGDDSRTIEAAKEILQNKLAKLIVLGKTETISKALDGYGSAGNLKIIDPLSDPRLKEYTEKYYELQKIKGISIEDAAKFMQQPLFFGAMLVREGIADGSVGGAVNTTANVLRSGLRIIGTKPGIKTVSSCFIMVSKKKEFGNDGVLIFADCAVNPDPTAEMLADIAISTSHTCQSLLKIDPVIALLSFSTKGSAKSPSTQKVDEALDIIKNKSPNLNVDGEMQLDTALVPSVGARKAPGSSVAGKANILIFPNLDAGNIGYKIAERFGDTQAIGPIIQGFAKPVNDLSRGASASDIVNVVAITSITANF